MNTQGIGRHDTAAGKQLPGEVTAVAQAGLRACQPAPRRPAPARAGTAVREL
jgi:hypothetical protein